MSAIGGSIESVNIDGREFAVTADADVSRKLGGKENELMPNGNGTARVIQTTNVWSLSGVVVQVDDTLGDHEFLQAIADAGTLVAVGITYASGENYQGRGIVAGELTASNQSASAALDLQGEGKLRRQA